MQLKIKGFVTIESLIRNTVNEVSPIGEISTYSLTYAEDKGIYAGGTDNQLRFYSFACHYDDGTVVEVPAAFRQQIFEVTQWLHDSASSDSEIVSPNALAEKLQTNFATKINAVESGALIEYSPGLKFPERLTWTNLTPATGDPSDDNKITLWFSDSAFADQYDEYKVIIVPPIDDIDSFFQNKIVIQSLLDTNTLGKVLTKIQEIKNDHPETILTSENYSRLMADGSKVNTTWMVLIYGKRGYDADVIRGAIRDYIAKNTLRREAEWRVIFPDIYKNSEFYLYPRWHALAIPERLLYSGTYSAIISLDKELTYLKERHPELTSAHILKNAQAFSCNYKSVAVSVVGGLNNRGGQSSISQVYPDLISVPFTDTLFEMMSLDTRNWIVEIENMVIVAETATNYTSIPLRMKKLNRNGILYISQRLGEHDYLVACKPSTPAYT
ncbi:MAG: hypothetical protein PHQ58_04965 [Rhodoferax sp.]|uniref:hypothetical protein n=1 Tax=Rhodoferax sp. TaxID=50421 RepID=UPI0026336DC5|nr:hypothetical protein [Rhodoferax sp.]MDD2879765.1 hypothetical protein [Rhodoferax sp.]